MRTEDFDEAVRQKIESVNPLFEEGEIDKVHNFVLKNRSNSSIRRMAYIFSAFAAAGIIGGLIFWNVIQMNDHKKLMETITDLQKSIAQKEASPKVSGNEAAFRNESSNIPNETPVIRNENPNIPNKTAPIIRNDNSLLPITGGNSAIIPKDQTNTLAAAATKELIQEKIIPAQDIPLTTETVIPDESPKNDGKEPEIVTNNPTITEMPVAEESISPTNDAIVPAPPKDPGINDMKQPESKPSLLKSISFRAGIGAEKANSQLGLNAIGTICLGSRWSVNAGIKYLTVNNGTYTTTTEYAAKKGKEFDDDDDDDGDRLADQHGHDHEHTSHGYSYSEISNIQVSSYVIQLPVSVAYRIPVGHSFALRIALGSDVDIYSKQNVNYTISQAAASDINRTVTKNATPATFNNIVSSVGIEKRWKFLYFGLDPFISPQLSTVNYKKESVYYGIHLSTGVVFGGK